MFKAYYIFLLANFLIVSTCFSQWNSSSSINNTITISPKAQQNIHMISDSKGGSMIVWEDNRNNTTGSSDIYAQRISNAGIIKWTTDGIAICTNNFTQKSVGIIDAGNGTAIITWEDNRLGNYDLYAQKIDSSGNILWATDGIVVCNKSNRQKDPKISSDNAGGAIIVWEDSVSNFWDIYAQHISSSGSQLWTSTGVAICTSPNTQANPRLDADGQGGAIITWQDKRGNLDYDIYAQRINSTGVIQWATDGVVISNAVGTQSNPRIEPDGANGAIIAWVDKRNGTDYNVYAQRVNASGATQWTANGAAICVASGNQSAVDMKAAGTGNILLTWKDDRTGTNIIYTQVISPSGTPQLASDGVALSNSLKALNPNCINDGAGGFIVVWQDSTASGWDIKAQQLNSAGTIQSVNGGTTICNATNDQINVSHCHDGNGGAIIAWEDSRNKNTSNIDIYASRFYNTGGSLSVNNIETKTVETICYPNPTNGTSTIQLKNNVNHSPWQISIFDYSGNMIETTSIVDANFYTLNSTNLSSGLYFYTIILAGKTAQSKGIINVVK